MVTQVVTGGKLTRQVNEQVPLVPYFIRFDPCFPGFVWF